MSPATLTNEEAKSAHYLKVQTEQIDKAIEQHIESKGSFVTSNSVSELESKDSIVTETKLLM